MKATTNCPSTLKILQKLKNVTDAVTNFGKALCSSASISWSPHKSENRPASFVLGFTSGANSTPQELSLIISFHQITSTIFSL
ncbi:hypothetical protein L6452_32443 [Arctium lappa]|uniref:Uncharacterized protein n=1 Tax=Arctium lappa TaxID=4217 RepID=A0ACB8Z4U1_ARCLA|nr:hypothetical protein L6452_32443 [Arctium lappa]